MAAWGSAWTRCENCGTATYDIDAHKCTPESIAQHECRVEFRRVDVHGPSPNQRWKAFDEWLSTPHGQFAVWLTKGAE